MKLMKIKCNKCKKDISDKENNAEIILSKEEPLGENDPPAIFEKDYDFCNECYEKFYAAFIDFVGE